MCPAPQLSPTFPPCPDPQRFSTFPPGPAPQLSPACSLVFLSSPLLSPGLYSFVHYSPAFFTERLKQKSQHTAANSMISTAFFCAFRFPSRGQVYRLRRLPPTPAAWNPVEGVKKRLVGVLGAVGGALGRSWRGLGGILGALGGSWEGLGVLLGRSWGILGGLGEV